MSTRDKTSIIVMGMHRSGTSLLSRLLSLSGVDLGKSGDVAFSREDNPRGFWEHALLSRINDELLAAFGGTWSEPPELPDGWVEDLRLDGIRERAREVLELDFGESPLWAFKDPRTSLVAPFWRPLISSRVAYVVAVRNPLEVADSLRARDGLPIARSMDLWHTYTRNALSNSSTGLRTIVHYERVLADPAGEVDRLWANLDLGRPPDAFVRDLLRGEAHSSLRHHRKTFADVAAHPEVPVAVRDVYGLLSNASGPDQNPEGRPL